MKQTLLTAAALTALMALPSLASAQDWDRDGWYVRGNIGVTGTTDMDIVGDNVTDLTGCARADFLSSNCVQEDLNGDIESEYNAGLNAALGYDFENPWRFEVELGTAWNETGAISQQGETSSEFRGNTAMINALYDFNEEGRYEPYVGLGLGFIQGELNAEAHDLRGIPPFNPNGQCVALVGPNCVGLVNPVGSGKITDDDTGWAYQVIAGLGVNLSDDILWDSYYKYVGANDLDFDGAGANGAIGSSLENIGYHGVYTGLRWQFWEGEKAVMVTCWDGSEVATQSLCPTRPVEQITCWDGSMAASQSSCPTRYTACPDGTQVTYGTSCPVQVTYYTCWDGEQVTDLANCRAQVIETGPCDQGDVPFVVYFEWDRSNLTAQAQSIIAQAASIASQCNIPGVTIEGHADSSGNAAYNVGLSQRRAGIVRSELERMGLATSVISTSAKGESELAVQTGDGVREPLNRRTEVLIRLAPAIYN